MNWITRSLVLTVLVCISFDHGYTATQGPNITIDHQGTDAHNQSSEGSSLDHGTRVSVTAQPGNAKGITTGNPGGNGAGELSAKVLMIATMTGCALVVYGGL